MKRASGMRKWEKKTIFFPPLTVKMKSMRSSRFAIMLFLIHFHSLRNSKAACLQAGKGGLRINPECSTQTGHAIYDPCSPGSRFGVTQEQFRPNLLDGVTGLHFHTLCQQNADDLETTLNAVEEKFGEWLPQMEWINFGGGHHITREGYDIPLLEKCIKRMQDKYGLEVYLEPGEAVALNAGYLVTTVLDTVKNGMDIAILDTSASCHMPDVLEMPYRPPLIVPGSRAKNRIRTGLAAKHASPAIRSAIIPSISRLKKAFALYLAIWPSTPW